MFSFFWPEIEGSDSARAASKLGATAAAIVALLTLGTMVFMLFVRHIPVSSGFAVTVIAIVLFSALAWGIWRESRIAALTALILYVLDYVVAALSTGWLSGLFVHAAITLFLLSGVRGTFAAHKYKASGADSPGTAL
jgi:hypothetical protein